MVLKVIEKVRENFNVKCEFCGKTKKRKSAHFEKVKLLYWVHPKLTAFCSEDCSERFKEYERSVPKKASLCSSCPVPPDAY